MVARAVSLAEHYRAHHAAMKLALEMGITPAEAASRLRRQANAAEIERLRQRRAMPLERPLDRRGIDGSEAGNSGSDAPGFWWKKED